MNETFARRVVGAIDPVDAVGRRFRRGSTILEIIGIVEDGKYASLTEAATPALFLPILQEYSRDVFVLARSHRREPELAAEIRQAMARLDPRVPVYAVGGLRDQLGPAYLPTHAAVIALGAFGLLALMLAVTGIYGLSSYAVSRRGKEIGIRMALGARSAQLLRAVFGHLGALVALGALAGFALGAAGARLLASIVYQAGPRDPVVMISSVLTLAAVAFAAAFGPARRAIATDPVESLRHE